jgi:hypothetical protein
MAQQRLPDIPSPRTTIYDNLLGVDFRSDQTEVERRRSPNMVNMISDLGGNPIKRDGYRKVANAYEGLVTAQSKPYGVRRDSNGVVVAPVTLEKGATAITEDAEKKITIPSSIPLGDIKAVLGYQQNVFILADNGAAMVDTTKYDKGGEAYAVTGLGAGMMSVGALGSTEPVCSSIIPLSIIGMNPNAEGTKGTVLYGKNLMSIYQQYSYAGDGTTKVFKIPLYSKMGAWAKVEVMDANANWVVKSLGTDYTLGTASNQQGVSLDGESVGTFSVVNAEITFTTAPPKPSSTLAGEDNVRITVAPFNMADKMTIGGQSDIPRGYYNENLKKLFDSNAHILFDARLFLAVADRTYYSEVNKPFLIPDNYYFTVDNDVIAYTRVSSYLAVITKDTGTNTIFLASAMNENSTIGDSMTVSFSVRPTNAGVGAITGNVGGVLNDEPILLSTTGLYGILTNWSSEKYAVNRSGRINRKLCKELNLENAVGCVFNGYYYLAINGQMYILDGRHKDNTRSGETSYECYYFNGLPDIKEMFVVDNKMFFTDGTDTYTWNSDISEAYRYYDNLVLDGNGEYVSGTPVHAWWSSVFDDDNAPQILKTLKKKGTVAVMTPYASTGAYVTLIKDGDEFQRLGYQNTAIFSFEVVDFGYGHEDEPDYAPTKKEESRFIFASNAVAYDRFTKKKIKKYKRLQIIVGNDRPEPFALTKVVKTYEVGNYAKR